MLFTVSALEHEHAPRRLAFLFTHLQHVESRFYGTVGEDLERRGHAVEHLTYSRAAARMLAGRGATAHCLPDLMDDVHLHEADIAGHVARIEQQYDIPSLRDIYRSDLACDDRSEAWCIERTVRHVLAIERLLDALRPDVVVPEVGNETMRTVAYLAALDRGARVLFLFYTIFPDPLRLCVDDMRQPLMHAADARALTPAERAATKAFIREFVERDQPIREARESEITAQRLRVLARHTAVKALYDRDNPYLRPLTWVAGRLRERVAARFAHRYYRRPRAGRPYVYFPLHVTDDYKIKRLVPHCTDQASIIEHVAESLPAGYDLLTKEHPMSIGRNPMGLLRRLHAISNVRIVAPSESSHELIAGAAAIVVISSTVGLEALLHGKPVLTIGEPFYARLGVTLDAASSADIRELVPAVLRYEPDPERILRVIHAAWQRCHPGAPVMVDRSAENARRLAGSIEAAAAAGVAAPAARSVGAGAR
ncbi:MAG: hypothetical protein QOE11_2818 [Solirubrobacteraceae bacterium]|jgi:hypothetical protein|nr:hypothetical protein [Solirubrobacteraceae bacterium]